MLTSHMNRLSAEERAKHEKFLAIEETESSLRRKRMWAAFQLLGLVITGIAVSILTYNLWTGGPAQAAEALPRTVFGAVVFLLVFTFLSGRGAPRDYQTLQELKQDARRALDGDKAETIAIALNEDCFVLRHPEGSFLVSPSEKQQSAVVDLSVDDALIAMFSQPSPPLGQIEWVQEPGSSQINHVTQTGLPPASLDRIDLPGKIGKDAVHKALGLKSAKPVTLSKTPVADLRDKVDALLSA